MKEKLLRLLKPQASPEVKLSVVALFIAKVLESLEPRIQSLEERQLQKGDKGDKGDQGIKGDRGEVGPQGIAGIMGLPGKDGSDGKAGKKGEKGKDGVSVVDAEIAVDSHLVLKLSDGKIVDAGELPQAKGESGGVFVSGNAWQISVSAVAPSNPQVNDLWLDIS